MEYECEDGTEIFTEPGGKGKLDFKTRYKNPGGRTRTPSHSNYLTDLLIKRENDTELTNSLVEELLYLAENVEQSESNDPELQLQLDHSSFHELDNFGELSTELILVSYELILIQERNKSFRSLALLSDPTEHGSQSGCRLYRIRRDLL